MSGDPEQEYFVDGMVEDLTTDLSKLSGLVVISRHSAFAYKGTGRSVGDIARGSGVRYLVEGSVRRDGHRVRIAAHLIDSASSTHLWADRYDRDLKDISPSRTKSRDALSRKVSRSSWSGSRRIASATKAQAVSKPMTCCCAGSNVCGTIRGR